MCRLWHSGGAVGRFESNRRCQPQHDVVAAKFKSPIRTEAFHPTPQESFSAPSGTMLSAVVLGHNVLPWLGLWPCGGDADESEEQWSTTFTHRHYSCGAVELRSLFWAIVVVVWRVWGGGTSTEARRNSDLDVALIVSQIWICLVLKSESWLATFPMVERTSFLLVLTMVKQRTHDFICISLMYLTNWYIITF